MFKADQERQYQEEKSVVLNENMANFRRAAVRFFQQSENFNPSPAQSAQLKSSEDEFGRLNNKLSNELRELDRKYNKI